MAYYNQERKKAVQPAMRKLLKEYGLKGSLSVQNHSTVVLTIKSGIIDFANSRAEKNPTEVFNQIFNGPFNQQVNVYWIDEHWTGKAKEFLRKANDLLNIDNYDNSDSMTDYFDVGWYVDINLGKWNQPYVYEPGASDRVKKALSKKKKAIKKKSTKKYTALEGEATKKQLWALFCITKKDHRDMGLSRQEAYDMLQELTS